MRTASADDTLLEWRIAQPHTLAETAPKSHAESFRREFGWEPGPHWALFDGQGRLLTHGDRPPTVALLRESLLEAGVPSQVQVLEDFCRKHPDQEEARALLLGILFQISQVRMQTLAVKTVPGAPKELLAAETDERIWGKTARILDRYLAGGEWRNGLITSIFEGMANGIGRSALVTSVIRRHLPPLEAQLRRMPGSSTLWSLWRDLYTNTGGRSLGQLLGGMEPLPGQTSLWPSPAILETLADECASPDDWNRFSERMAPRWAERRRESAAKEERSWMTDALVLQQWQQGPARLLQAFLKSQRIPEAEQVLREARRWWPTGNVPTRAAGIAQECGAKDLAQRWSQWPGQPPEDELNPPPQAPMAGTDPSTPVLSGAIAAPRIQLLAAFLRTHPEHAEARQALASEYLKASCRAPATLAKEPTCNADPVPLTLSQDQQRWGRTAQALDGLFKSGEWRFDGAPWSNMSLAAARCSPIMSRMAQSWVAEVEEALGRQPANSAFWRLWIQLAGLIPQRSIQPLLANLEPTPFSRPWPPTEAIAILVKENRTRKAWKRTVELLEPVWNLEVQKLDPSAEAPREPSLLSERLWEGLAAPLLEAGLRSDHITLADRVLEEYQRCFGKEGLATRAVAVAVACGRIDIAARWASSRSVARTGRR